MSKKPVLAKSPTSKTPVVLHEINYRSWGPAGRFTDRRRVDRIVACPACGELGARAEWWTKSGKELAKEVVHKAQLVEVFVPKKTKTGVSSVREVQHRAVEVCKLEGDGVQN